MEGESQWLLLSSQTVPLHQSYRLAEQEQSDRSLIENSETNTDWERPTTAIEKWLRTWIKARMQKHIPLGTVTLCQSSDLATVQMPSWVSCQQAGALIGDYQTLQDVVHWWWCSCTSSFIPVSQWWSCSNTMSLTQPIEIDQGDF